MVLQGLGHPLGYGSPFLCSLGGMRAPSPAPMWQLGCWRASGWHWAVLIWACRLCCVGSNEQCHRGRSMPWPPGSPSVVTALCVPANCFWIREQRKEEKPITHPVSPGRSKSKHCSVSHGGWGWSFTLIDTADATRSGAGGDAGWVGGWLGRTGRAGQPGRAAGCLDIQLGNQLCKCRLEPQGQFLKATNALARPGLSCTTDSVAGSSLMLRVPSEQECFPCHKTL